MLEFTPVKIYFWSADYFEILKVYTTYNEEQIEIFELIGLTEDVAKDVKHSVDSVYEINSQND